MSKFVYQNEIGGLGADMFVHTTLKKALIDYCKYYGGKFEDDVLRLGNLPQRAYNLDWINSEIKGSNYVTFSNDHNTPVLTIHRLEVK